MLNKNKIETVLYVDHTRPNPNPEKISYKYEGHKIIIYAVGHGEKAIGIFNNLYNKDHKKIDLIIEDSTDSYISQKCIDILKNKYKFRGHHKFVTITNKHIEKISGKANPEEKLFLEDLVHAIAKEHRGKNFHNKPEAKNILIPNSPSM